MSQNAFWRARFELAGLSQATAARLCGVTVRQVKRWEAGQARTPPAALALVRLVGGGDLGQVSPAWCGWRLVRGQLFSPENVGFAPGEVRALPLLYGQLATLTASQAAASPPALRPLPVLPAARFLPFAKLAVLLPWRESLFHR